MWKSQVHKEICPHSNVEKNMKAHMAYKFPSLDNDGSKEQHKKRKNKYPTKKKIIKITKKN